MKKWILGAALVMILLACTGCSKGKEFFGNWKSYAIFMNEKQEVLNLMRVEFKEDAE